MDTNSELYGKIQSLDPNLQDVLLLMLEEIDLKAKLITVGRGDFEQLKDVVKDLAEAQKQTQLEVRSLAEAQKRTEAKVSSLTEAVESLAEAQKRTEAKVSSLAEAQERTEAKVSSLTEAVESLAEAQKRTEAKVSSLAEAQERTEASVKVLADGLADVRKQLGGLAMAVGYGIEDRLMPHLERFALLEFGITAGTADRLTITYPNGRHDEINIYVEGEKDGRKAYLIGECKSQPGKRDFGKLEEMLDRLRRHLDGEVMGMMVGYNFAPEVAAYAMEHHPDIKRYKTYEIERASSTSAA